jgi:Holliday junction DNA helicase RuvB
VEPTGDILRAQTWDEYMGQAKLKARLGLCIEAANNKNRMVDHVLLDGPPGYGKTTLAQIIADQTGHSFEKLTMPVKPKVLARFLQNWEGGVLFLDEIHRPSRREQEDLLLLVEEGYLQLDTGRRIYVPDTTIIGATTERAKVLRPLRERFPLRPETGVRFVDYSDAEIGRIVQSMASKVDVALSEKDAVRLGRASGGTPRVARSLVLYARDLQDTDQPVTVEAILEGTQMEPDGLSADHMQYLAALAELGGASVGLNNLVNVLHTDEPSVRELERLLQKRGLIRFEPTGRELSQTGFKRTRKKAA